MNPDIDSTITKNEDEEFIKLTPEVLEIFKEICRQPKEDFRQTKESQLSNN